MMSVNQILTGFLYLAVILVLLVIGKWVYDGLHRRFVLRTELIEKENLAVALAVAGYYLGLVIVLGGVVSGPASFSVVDDVIGLVIFGLLGIVLLNLSAWINDKVVFSKFDNEKEIVEDRNAGMGAVEGGNYVAVGLITAGAMSGEGGLLRAWSSGSRVWWRSSSPGCCMTRSRHTISMIRSSRTTSPSGSRLPGCWSASGISFAWLVKATSSPGTRA